jgi:hypothetical protein
MAKLTFKPGYQDLGPFPLLQPIVNAEGLEVTETTPIVTGPDGFYPGLTKTSSRLVTQGNQVLQGYKISGSTFLNGSDNYTIYIGTVTAAEPPSNEYFGIAPYKVGGSVSIQYPCPFTTALANGASVWDDDAEQSIPVESIGFVTIPYDNIHTDLLLTSYDSTVATTFSAVVYYEYEFFASEKAIITFTPNI